MVLLTRRVVLLALACGVMLACEASPGTSGDSDLGPDGGPSSSCGSCDDEIECTLDRCADSGECVHTVKSGYCLIGGTCVPDGHAKPTDSCRVCDASGDPEAWSAVVDGTVCLVPSCAGLVWNWARTCVAGVCSGGGGSSDCDDGLTCTRDTCDSARGCDSVVLGGHCLIGGACVFEGQAHPGDACRVCDPERSSTLWSKAQDGTPCPDGNVCNGAETCRDGICTTGIPATDGEDVAGCISYFPDLDGDGHGAVDSVPRCLCVPDVTSGHTATSALDCDDEDGAVHPDADEVCDAVDNDCNGVTDDPCDCIHGDRIACYTGEEGTVGVGLCREGQRTCEAGTWGSCDGEVTPVAEKPFGCDFLDNDCDGRTDNDITPIDAGDEPNNGCAALRARTVRDDDTAPTVVTAALYPDGDIDLYQFDAQEWKQDACFPGDSECNWLDVELVQPEHAGVAFQFLVLADNCESPTATHGPRQEALRVQWDGRCGLSDSRSFWIQVEPTGASNPVGSCKPYQLKVRYTNVAKHCCLLRPCNEGAGCAAAGCGTCGSEGFCSKP